MPGSMQRSIRASRRCPCPTGRRSLDADLEMLDAVDEVQVDELRLAHHLDGEVTLDDLVDRLDEFEAGERRAK